MNEWKWYFVVMLFTVGVVFGFVLAAVAGHMEQPDCNLVTDIIYKTDTIYIDNSTEVDCVQEIYDKQKDVEDMRSILNEQKD